MQREGSSTRTSNKENKNNPTKNKENKSRTKNKASGSRTRFPWHGLKGGGSAGKAEKVQPSAQRAAMFEGTSRAKHATPKRTQPKTSKPKKPSRNDRSND